MSWEDILKEFTPDEERNEYYRIMDLLDYIIENYPDKANNAKSVKKDVERIVNEFYEMRDTIKEKLSKLAQYITRGKSNTLRDTYTEYVEDLMKRLFYWIRRRNYNDTL